MMNLRINESLSVTLYDSIKEFPASLQLEAKLYAIMRSGLATTEEELSGRKDHMELLQSFNLQDYYQTELQNYNIAVSLIEQGFSAIDLEWACHLAIINGVEVAGYTEEVLINRVSDLKDQGLTVEQIGSSLEAAKQQMVAEIKRYFPARIAHGKFNNLQRLLDYGLALADHVEFDSKETKEVLDKVTLQMLSMQKPPKFSGDHEDVLRNMELSQFELYASLQEAASVDPKKLTVFEFYGWLGIMEKRIEQQKSDLAKVNKR